MLQRIEKAWGFEQVICNEPEYCSKHLHINAGWQCSLHMHPVKKETFHVISGVVRLQLGLKENITVMVPGDTVTIVPGKHHRFGSLFGAVIAETSTHHDDNDVVRLEESRRIE